MHRQIDGNIEHFGPFRVIHAQKKNVAPTAMRQVHAHWRGLAENRVRAILQTATSQFRAKAERLIGRVAHAKHPLIAPNRAHAATDLIGEGLKAETMVSCAQPAGESFSW